MAEKDRRLHARRAALDALEIREVHIHGGGSDLRVGLSEAARWLGGSKETAFGQKFQANVPTEENFTTPDRRTAEGRLAATMPFRTRTGLLVKGLAMEFEKGRLVRFEAQEGAAEFARWIDLDEGARYLGELALVGADSAIAQERPLLRAHPLRRKRLEPRRHRPGLHRRPRRRRRPLARPPGRARLQQQLDPHRHHVRLARGLDHRDENRAKARSR